MEVNAIKEHILKNYPVNPEDLYYVPRGIDTDFFDPEKIDTDWIEQFKKSINYTIEKLSPLWDASRPGKGQDDFIRSHRRGTERKFTLHSWTHCRWSFGMAKSVI